MVSALALLLLRLMLYLKKQTTSTNHALILKLDYMEFAMEDKQRHVAHTATTGT